MTNTTRVQHLTDMNIRALREVNITWSIGSTYADFAGDPKTALTKVEAALTGRATSWVTRSLHATRRKLTLAAAQYRPEALPEGWSQVTAHVRMYRPGAK